MKILFISPNSPFESIGGIERYVVNLINYYKNFQDGEVFLILPTTGKSYSKKEGSITVYFESNFSIPKDLEHNQKETTKKAHLFIGLVEKIINENKIDIICAENLIFGPPPVYSLLLNMIATSHQIPLILRLHSFATTDLQVELINQLMWRQISCVSKSVAGDCFHKGANINTLATHYLGADIQEFNNQKSIFKLREQLQLPAKSKIILTASRIIRGKRNILQEKGIINLIQAFSKISPYNPHLRLLIAVGKAPQILDNEFKGAYEMLMGYIKLHNIESSTVVKTFQLDEMPQVYRECDVFALPSQNETFGQVFIESMSCGLPVIGTKVGGIPEIISDSYNGYLIQPDDASILAQKIETLIKDKTIRKNFIKAGLKTVKERFDSDQQFSSFQNTLKSLI